MVKGFMSCMSTSLLYYCYGSIAARDCFACPPCSSYVDMVFIVVLAAGLAGHAAANTVHDVVAGACALQRGHLAAPRLCQGLAAHLHAPRSQKVPLHGPSLRGRPVGANLPLCTLLLLTNLPLMIALHAEQHDEQISNFNT